jgi:hypothetical protein
MSAGAAIAAMAEQARTKACDRYMLKLCESSCVFEMFGVLGWQPGQGQGKIYILTTPRVSNTLDCVTEPLLNNHAHQASTDKAMSLLWESIYDTGERRPAVLIAVQPQADKLTSIRPQELVCGRHELRLNSTRTMDRSQETMSLNSGVVDWMCGSK